MKKQDMNLLTVYQQVVKRKADQDATVYVYGMLIVGAILAAGAFYGVLFFENQVVERDIKVVQDYLTSPQVLERSNEFSLISQEIKDLEGIILELQSAKEAMSFIPRPGTQIFNRVLAERPGSVRIDEMIFGGGDIVLSVTATRVYSISDFVLRLRRTEYFQEVRYSGYTLEEGRYSSNIRVILKGGQ
jgi:hypothetical protein